MSELSELKRMGAKPVSNSGRGTYLKGDGILGPFTVDVKEYPKGYTVNKKHWAKICSDAAHNGMTDPMLAIVLGEGDNRTRLAVVTMDIIEDYLRLRELEVRINTPAPPDDTDW